MLGQPVYFLTPDVVGVELKGKLSEGITATDLVLTVTEMLRKEKVVGKFVEFFGEGTATLSVPDRATIGNMAPEYGATMGFFPVDQATVDYLAATGRTAAEIDAFASYFKAQGMFGIPKAGEIDYTKVVSLDLATIKTSLAGPEAPAGPHRARATSRASSPSSSASRSPRTASAKPAAELNKRIVTPMVADGVGAISDASMQLHDGAAPRDVVEMVNNRPTPDQLRRAARQARVDRQRRRADRRDHVVHEHVQSRRAARRRPARQEGGRARAHREAGTSRRRSRPARAPSPST